MLHRLVRKVIVWASTPSEEEVREKSARWEKERAERLKLASDRLQTKLLKMVQHKPLPTDYIGWMSLDLRRAAHVISSAAVAGAIDDDIAKAHLKKIREVGGYGILWSESEMVPVSEGVSF